MKKKLFSLVVTLVMALSLAVPAMAAEITIENPAPNETYTAYKIFDVTKSDLICGQEAGAGHTHSDNCYSFSYSILTTNPWYDTVVKYANAIDATDADGLTLVPVASDSGKFTVDFDNNKFSAAAFAAALNTANESVTDTGYTSTGGKITVPDAGYYFVDTTLGSLCSLLTSDSSQELVEKNSIPSLEKFVKEDSKEEAEAWGAAATAEYGQTVDFWLSVNTGTNEDGTGTGVDANYKIVDEIPDHMTLVDKNAEDAEDYITINGWTEDTDYTESYDPETNILTIELLASGKLGHLGKDADIEIYYSATLDSDATVYVKEENVATLTYKNQTDEAKASVVTYSIEGQDAAITKTDGENPLEGVKFVLMNGDQYATFDSSMKLTGWDSQEKATELVTDEYGKIHAYGLDAGTYTLKETETLPGYNLLNDTITAVIAEDGTVTYKYTSSEGDGANNIEIVNESGAILPGTGGMGTTIFYVVGGTLVVAAAVLLITKKRMHNAED